MDRSHPSHIGVEYETELHKKRQRRTAPPLAGRTFGSWTVLATPPRRDKPGMWWFEVQCQCGTRRWIRAQRLMSTTDNNVCRACYRAARKRKDPI